VKFWRWLFWMALLLAACAPSFQDCPRSEVRCAVLLMHPWEEGTLSRQTWNALQAAQQAGQLQGAWKVIVRDARDRERELRWMAEQGIDLIITLSPSWQEETQRVARQFPQARFIALDQSPPPQALANLTLILIPYDQLGFLAGALAARVTGTYSGKHDLSRQVTLIEMEALEALARDYHISLLPIESRRNIATRGVALNHLVGKRFRVGEAVLLGMELCEPCGYLEQKSGKPVRLGLIHRGGLRAQILESGRIRVGDPVEVLEA
jgi:hypothetical protein